MELIQFTPKLLDTVYEIQRKSYKPLFDKYHDENTNPYMETKEKVLEKYTRPGTAGYVFVVENTIAGAVRVTIANDTGRISALCVLPECQNKGIAQRALLEIEKRYPNLRKWVLDTLLEEKGNCHLYEKLGYVRVGEPKKINENLTLVDYVKEM